MRKGEEPDPMEVLKQGGSKNLVGGDSKSTGKKHAWVYLVILLLSVVGSHTNIVTDIEHG